MKHPTRLPAKKDVVLALLESTDVFVHLDPRTDKVRVPNWFKHQPNLVLQIGLNMPVPIPDLNVDDDSVSCTLSFNRSPHYCVLPWQAIYALVGADGRAMVWPDDVPPEVAAQAEQVQKKQAARAHLRAVPEGEVETGSATEPAAAPQAAEPAQLELQMPEPEPQAPLRSQPRSARPQESDGPDESPAEPSDGPPASEPPKPGKKRELPSYLRVVK